MSVKNGLNRRDFFKIGGITAGALGAASVMDLVTDGEMLSTDDVEGFYIRYHDPENLPYEIDETVYTQIASPEASHSRSPAVQQQRMETTRKHIVENKLGSDRLAYAYGSGAATFMFDHRMYSWEQHTPDPMQQLLVTRWIPEEDGYTIEDVTKIIKRATKMYGASLVGVAPLNERWFYTHEGNSGGMMSGNSMPMEPMDLPALQQRLPQMLESMDPEARNGVLFKLVEHGDSTTLPTSINLKNASPELLQDLLPQILENMDPSAITDISVIVGQMNAIATAQANMKKIRFSDDIDEPETEADDAKRIPRSMNRVVVMAFEMDEEGINTQNSHLAGGSVKNAYSRMAFTSACLATFIRNLGYNALPMGNDHALSIPMAVDAGLGEIGRNGMLITPQYGPRVRLAKVVTDLPLVPDRPISFGVTEFCDICGKCADLCPSGAISVGNRTYEATATSIPGHYHWPVDGDKCFEQWAVVGGGCSECIRVCPFNKPEGWLHEATRILIGVKSGSLDQVLLRLDDAAGFGGEEGNDLIHFWDIDSYIHIKS